MSSSQHPGLVIYDNVHVMPAYRYPAYNFCVARKIISLCLFVWLNWHARFMPSREVLTSMTNAPTSTAIRYCLRRFKDTAGPQQATWIIQGREDQDQSYSLTKSLAS